MASPEIKIISDPNSILDGSPGDYFYRTGEIQYFISANKGTTTRISIPLRSFRKNMLGPLYNNWPFSYRYEKELWTKEPNSIGKTGWKFLGNREYNFDSGVRVDIQPSQTPTPTPTTTIVVSSTPTPTPTTTTTVSPTVTPTLTTTPTPTPSRVAQSLFFNATGSILSINTTVLYVYDWTLKADQILSGGNAGKYSVSVYSLTATWNGNQPVQVAGVDIVGGPTNMFVGSGTYVANSGSLQTLYSPHQGSNFTTPVPHNFTLPSYL